MKLLVLSDLHLEQHGGASYTTPAGLDYDAVVLAGDVQRPGREAVRWAARESQFGRKPVLFVAGNHEFYKDPRFEDPNCKAPSYEEELDEMKRAAAGSNVHLLDRDSVVVNGVRFVGCTLWTDFQLPVQAGDGAETDVGKALLEASARMYDYREINVTVPATPGSGYRKTGRRLQAGDTLKWHWVDRDWLRRQLMMPFDGLTVVITHHAPSMMSVAPKYAADWVTPAFVSDLPDSFFDVPAVWIHGHTHSPFNYRRGNCQVVSNPRGYRQPDSSFENHRFDAGLVVEVAAQGQRPTDRAQRIEAASREYVSPAETMRLMRTTEVEAVALRADMVDSRQAAVLAGTTEEQLLRWAASLPPTVIGLKHADLGWRFPRWQFEPWLWPVVQQLPQVIAGGAIPALRWLEMPHGAFGGRTPRVALEQGELPERVLAIAAAA